MMFLCLERDKGRIRAFCLAIEWGGDEDSIQDGFGEGRVLTVSRCRDYKV